jgi:hypothetical protein
VLRGMPNAAQDSRVRFQTANSRYALARLKLNLGHATAAEEDARAALTQGETLVAEDASNLTWLAETCFERLRLAEIELALDRATEARLLVERTSGDVARLVASDASALNWTVDLQGLLVDYRARIALAQRRAAARPDLYNYIAQIQRLTASGIQLDGSQCEIVAEVELLAGDAAYSAGDGPAARTYWSAALQRLLPESDGRNYAALTLLGRLRLRQGDTAAARHLLSIVRASSFRHPAYAEFTTELAQAGTASGVSAKR